uniref:MATH domain-containing protein n=1 Tax=Denticeps clupeoides TaxID=299321 RepID=A0AAY4E774_9TELE
MYKTPHYSLYYLYCFIYLEISEIPERRAVKMTSITCYTQCKAERFSLTWTITNFSFAEGCVESSFFTNAREQLKWSLFLSTNGVGFQNERCLSFYINLVSGPETGVRCKGRMAILNSKGEECVCVVESLMEGFAIGLPNFARWDDIMAEEAGILQDDTLTLTCEVSSVCITTLGLFQTIIA